MAKQISQIIDEHFELAKNNVVYIAGNYTKFHMIKMFGGVLSIYNDTPSLREDWNYYNAIHGEDFIRLLDGFMKEYNPIENYDRYEDTTVDFSKGTQIDDFQSAEKNGSVENKVSAFDTEGYSNSNKSDTHSAGYTDISTSGSREDSTDTTSHIHGNIGITSNTQLLMGEALIRYNDLVNKYIERWARGVIVGYDDDNYREYTDDHYVTESELNAVKDDVTTLQNRVNIATSNISRLDNSLTGALSDITELYAQVDEVANNVSGLTDIVDNNTDDIQELMTEVNIQDGKINDVIEDLTQIYDDGFASKNMLEAYEQGNFDNNGTNVDSTTRCRNKGYIEVKGNTEYTISLNGNVQVDITYFSAQGSARLSHSGYNNAPYTFTTPSDAKYIRILFRKADNSNITPNEFNNVMLNVGGVIEYMPYAPSNIELKENFAQISNYPYTETQIGVLADGKKIYRRVYVYSGDLALVDNTWTKTNIAWMGAIYILKAQICMSNGLMLYVDTGNVEGMLAFNHHRTVTLSQTSTMLIILEYAK